jgi:putative flippase GtrA
MTRFNVFVGAMLAAVHAPRAALELRRLGKFAVVGPSRFIVDFAALNLLMFRFGLPARAANTCSFTAAVSNTFIWNRLWTFPESRQRPLTTQLAQFFLPGQPRALVGSRFFALGWSYNLAKAAVSGVTVFWNFGSNCAWAWRGL